MLLRNDETQMSKLKDTFFEGTALTNDFDK
jgi:hypothetical protein